MNTERGVRMKRTKEAAYEKRFARLAGRVEKWLVVMIVVGWVLLIAGQYLLTYEPVRYFLVDTVRMEGIASP
ncbi:hypothetical protein [Aneurinibacillus sp. REN35]|uniref:hypothetical protein n=1 Tax=Aneurinibacillus sp. REN35 TaxID=3237286 RepID=UPI0035277125